MAGLIMMVKEGREGRGFMIHDMKMVQMFKNALTPGVGTHKSTNLYL